MEKEEKVTKMEETKVAEEDIELVLEKAMSCRIKEKDLLVDMEPKSRVRQLVLSSLLNLNVALEMILDFILQFSSNTLH